MGTLKGDFWDTHCGLVSPLLEGVFNGLPPFLTIFRPKEGVYWPTAQALCFFDHAILLFLTRGLMRPLRIKNIKHILKEIIVWLYKNVEKYSSMQPLVHTKFTNQSSLNHPLISSLLPFFILMISWFFQFEIQGSNVSWVGRKPVF